MKRSIKKLANVFGYDIVKLKTSGRVNLRNGKKFGPFLSHQHLVDTFEHAEKNSENLRVINSFKEKIDSKQYCIDSFSCPVCESKHFTPVAKSLEGFKWGICQACGLLQCFARLPCDQLNEFYESGEYQIICMNNLDDQTHYDIEYQVNSLCFTDVFEKLNVEIKDKHIVEIGCGSGGILRALQDKGASVYGFDIDSYRIEAGKKYINDLFVFDAMSNDYPLPDKVDYIILSNILEHLFDPQAFLKNLWKKIHAQPNLKRTRLLIDVPNLETACNDTPDHFLTFLHIAHLWYFNSITMQRLLNQSGFDIEYIFSRQGSFTLVVKMLETEKFNDNNSYWNTISSINYANYIREENNLHSQVKEKLAKLFS
jgi:2-polyprenyl-3-methyl-5-hydroxy-6-metoxy-1,4-benzoquinol methylase